VIVDFNHAEFLLDQTSRHKPSESETVKETLVLDHRVRCTGGHPYPARRIKLATAIASYRPGQLDGLVTCSVPDWL
jgi:hypothetical protein